MKANPFLVGGAVAGGAALIALLIKAFTGGRKDPASRLINTLPRSTLRSEAAANPSIVGAFMGGGTRLGADDEAAFSSDYAKYSSSQGLDPNPDDPRHFYDYRGAWRSGGGLKPDAQGHLPSEFKMPGHPRMVLDGVNTKTGKSTNPPTPPRPVSRPKATTPQGSP